MKLVSCIQMILIVSYFETRINYYFHETTVIHYKGESTIKDEYMQHFQEAMNFFIKAF
jgi:hypothetical protein